MFQKGVENAWVIIYRNITGTLVSIVMFSVRQIFTLSAEFLAYGVTRARKRNKHVYDNFLELK
jgi:hypothetical protein